MAKQAYSFTATFKIARLDGHDMRDVTISQVVVVEDREDIEAIAHCMFFDKTIPMAYPNYKVLQLPTETNGKLWIRRASDYGFNR